MARTVKRLSAMWESPGLGRSPGEGNDNPLQYYCLENPMDRGAWQATVYGVAKNRTGLSHFTSLWLLNGEWIIRKRQDDGEGGCSCHPNATQSKVMVAER